MSAPDSPATARSEAPSQSTAKAGDEASYKTTPQDFLDVLGRLGVAHEVFHHEAVFTVAESHKVKDMLPGAHCRNLALYNKKKHMWLVVAQDSTPIDLKKLDGVLGAGRLSFMQPDRLWDYLGVRAGSVNPFAIMNDVGKDVTIVLDRSMMDQDLVNYHPMINTMSIALTPSGLLKFLEWTGHAPVMLDPALVAPDAA